MTTKKFMLVNRKAPYGSIYALESLDVALISAAFDQDVSLAFLDDGVYQITKGQDSTDIHQKNFSHAYKALGDYGITKIYVEQESLSDRGLAQSDLMHLVWEDENDNYTEKSSILIVSRQNMAEIMSTQEVVLSF